MVFNYREGKNWEHPDSGDINTLKPIHNHRDRVVFRQLYKKQIPKLLLWPITTEFLTVTCNLFKEQGKIMRFGFAPYRMKNWCNIFKPITILKCSNGNCSNRIELACMIYDSYTNLTHCIVKFKRENTDGQRD